MAIRKIDIISTQRNQSVDLIKIRSTDEVSSDSDSNKSNSCFFDIPEPSGSALSESWSTCEDNLSVSSSEVMENLTISKKQPFQVFFKDKIQVDYQYVKALAKGSYGEVFLLSRKTKGSDSHPETLCLKIGLKRGDVDRDAVILKQLKGCNCQNTLVDSAVLELKFLDSMGQEQFEPVIVMEHMEGNLKHFFQSYRFKTLSDKYAVVLYSLSQISTCFFHMVNRGLYYTDIKISNCLYRKSDKGFRVVLGDIGSAFPSSSDEAIATYPHIYHKRCHHFTPDIYDLVYGLLILFLEMMTVSHGDQEKEMSVSIDLLDSLYFKEVKHLSVEDRIKHISMMFEELEAINKGDHFLNQILKSIKKYTILDMKNIRETDHATQLHKLYKFFKTSYQKILETSSIGKFLGL